MSEVSRLLSQVVDELKKLNEKASKETSRGGSGGFLSTALGSGLGSALGGAFGRRGGQGRALVGTGAAPSAPITAQVVQRASGGGGGTLGSWMSGNLNYEGHLGTELGRFGRMAEVREGRNTHPYLSSPEGGLRSVYDTLRNRLRANNFPNLGRAFAGASSRAGVIGDLRNLGPRLDQVLNNPGGIFSGLRGAGLGNLASAVALPPGGSALGLATATRAVAGAAGAAEGIGVAGAAGAGGVLSGAAAALGPVGIAVGVATALVGVGKALKAFSEGINRANDALAPFSGVIARSKALEEVGEFRRNIAIAQGTEGSAALLSRSSEALKNALVPLTVAWKNFLNVIGTTINYLLIGITKLIEGITEPLNKFLRLYNYKSFKPDEPETGFGGFIFDITQAREG